MIREHDLVVLCRDLDGTGLEAGDVGVAVAVLAGGTLEVEFVDASGHNLGVITLGPEDVRSLDGAEILHVRPLSPA
jgi:hypothetical protein